LIGSALPFEPAQKWRSQHTYDALRLSQAYDTVRWVSLSEKDLSFGEMRARHLQPLFYGYPGPFARGMERVCYPTVLTNSTIQPLLVPILFERVEHR